MYSEEYPNGDFCALNYPIFYEYEVNITILHTLWDYCLGQYGEVKIPLTDEEFGQHSKYYKEIIAEYPKEKFTERLKIKSFEQWQREGYDLLLVVKI
jgi:hypothetical protein